MTNDASMREQRYMCAPVHALVCVCALCEQAFFVCMCVDVFIGVGGYVRGCGCEVCCFWQGGCLGGRVSVSG